MSMVTFLVPGSDGPNGESLDKLGFHFAPPEVVTITVLDTFDGRLHRAGLRLQANEVRGLELVLSGEATGPAHLVVRARPRTAADLPPGPFRARLATVTDGRALLPQLRVRTRRTSGEWRDATGKVVALAQLHDDVRILDLPAITNGPATVEIDEVPGYPKQARQAIKALRHEGLVEAPVDTLAGCAAAAGVDFAGFDGGATVPLDPEITAFDGFRSVLARLATTITANWQGTIDELDPEFLHDLRIGIRRTRTILSESKSVLPAAVLNRTRRDFSWLGGLSGPPRDLDVYILEWPSYIAPLGAEIAPALAPVREILERSRTEVHADLAAALQSDRATELIVSWSHWLTAAVDDDDLPSRADRPLGRLVAKRIRRAHDGLIERGRLIDPDTPAEQVHELRKDAKKLRYLLECFGSLLPAGPRKRYVKRLKALQDNLGEHQDSEVHVGMLRGIARQLFEADAPADTMVAIGRLTDLLDRRCLAARAEFAERFADYDSPATQQALDAVLEGITG